MDIIDAIKKRRSVRNFKPDEIPEEVLDKLLNAMRLAPSGANRQPRKFIVIRDQATKAKLADACKFYPGRPNGQPFIAEAPVVIVACGSKKEAATLYYEEGQITLGTGQTAAEKVETGAVESRTTVELDLAIALDHLTLTAVAEGLGTCWVGGFDDKPVKKLLSIPDDMSVPIVMPVGYPVAWPEPRPRKPLEEIICHEKYG